MKKNANAGKRKLGARQMDPMASKMSMTMSSAGGAFALGSEVMSGETLANNVDEAALDKTFGIDGKSQRTSSSVLMKKKGTF